MSGAAPGTGPTLRLTRTGELSSRGEPVRCGLPWPEGALDDPDRLRLFDPAGAPQTLQTRTLECWPDGSVRWCLLDWLARSGGGDYTLELGERRSDQSPLGHERADASHTLRVETGAADFTLRVGGGFPFDGVEIAGEPAIDCATSGLRVRDARGAERRIEVERLEVAEAGPVRLSVRLAGRWSAPGAGPPVEIIARLDFFADSATVGCEIALSNPRAAGHPGGTWELGGAGSVYLADLSLELVLPGGGGTSRALCSAEPASAWADEPLPLELHQESSGGENWRSSTHLDRHGEIPLAFPGYRLTTPAGERRGRRATPILALERGKRHLATAMRHFWQNFPKSLTASEDRLRIGLFPGQHADLHELQGGEQKTHRFWIAFDRDPITDPPLAWCRDPLMPHADREWYAAAVAVPDLAPRSVEVDRRHAKLLGAALEGESSFFAKRETVDEYGWRHFGELWADHEAIHHPGDGPLISHYNNQYDAIAGFAIQFMSSGDARWFELMDDLARHVVDIDIYHTDLDKSAYNHGLFWHTVHHTDAGKSTHRSYPAAKGVHGGGPSGGHLYTTGLLLHHLVTGWEPSRRAALELGRYVIDADDGSRTVFRFIDRGYTGHVSRSSWDDYHGPGRAPANGVNALLDAHRLTSDARYLDKAEQLIRRSIHPNDDLDARQLENVEHRWFYTMFLIALGKYLEHKELLGQDDAMYLYARAALLHYARWAVENEYPYLDKPEILEHPTETWAAQDMRKADMLVIAARHCAGELRHRCLDRAAYFRDASLRQLETMPSSTLCRPQVLMSSLGRADPEVERRASRRAAHPPSEPPDFGEPLAFVSQKRRAKRKLRNLLLAGVGLAAAALLAWVG